MGLIWPLAALIWGGAEATLFFIVPDVLLTLAVLRLGVRPAFWLMVFALVGALIGGTALYLWAQSDLDAARRTVDMVPLVTPEMIADVSAAMKGDWLMAMIWGALSGTPYKVFAIEAPAAGVSFMLFLDGSILARSVRWLLLIAVTGAIAALLRRAGLQRFALPLWGILWIAFYAFYVSVMP